MVRSFVLATSLCVSTGCSLMFGRAPTPSEWKRLEDSSDRPTMDCEPPLLFALQDSAAALGLALIGALLIKPENGSTDGGLAIPMLLFASSGGYVYSAYRGFQIQQACERFNAMSQRHPNDSMPGPIAPTP